VTASQKVHLRRCASSFVIAAYFYVRLISQDSRALHLKLFTVPSDVMTFFEVTKVSSLEQKRQAHCLSFLLTFVTPRIYDEIVFRNG
jgi:hypothetical protein